MKENITLCSYAFNSLNEALKPIITPIITILKLCVDAHIGPHKSYDTAVIYAFIDLHFKYMSCKDLII
jgi:hypothetical protein